MQMPDQGQLSVRCRLSVVGRRPSSPLAIGHRRRVTPLHHHSTTPPLHTSTSTLCYSFPVVAFDPFGSLRADVNVRKTHVPVTTCELKWRGQKRECDGGNGHNCRRSTVAQRDDNRQVATTGWFELSLNSGRAQGPHATAQTMNLRPLY